MHDAYVADPVYAEGARISIRRQLLDSKGNVEITVTHDPDRRCCEPKRGGEKWPWTWLKIERDLAEDGFPEGRLLIVDTNS